MSFWKFSKSEIVHFEKKKSVTYFSLQFDVTGKQGFNSSLSSFFYMQIKSWIKQHTDVPSKQTRAPDLVHKTGTWKISLSDVTLNSVYVN